MPTQRLQEQVHRIIDEGAGDRRSVIVQMTPSAAARPLAEAAVPALRRRSLTRTARDCLPPARGERPEPGALPRPALPDEAAGLTGSLSAPVDPVAVQAVSAETLKAQALARLAPLLDHGPVRQILARAAEGEGPAGEALWAASAVALELTVDELAELVEQVEGIAAVHLNRTHPVPPVVRVRNFPAAVLELRASAWGIEAVGALAAWGAYGSRGEGSTVAVLDTGVDDAHVDLLGKISAWAEFDAQGRPVPGTRPGDGHGHGTHVCGTIVGGDASGQWIGVAPDARVAVAKVIGPDGGTDAQVLAAIGWAIEQGVDAVNMSLGGLVLGPETPSTYTNAVVSCLRRGIPVVVAIGNDGAQTTGMPGNDFFALGVGATDHRDQPAGFSGGRTQIVAESEHIPPEYLPLAYSKPELSAPGVAVMSSIGSTWEALSGTSMATPHVAGAIALLLGATRIRDSVEVAERAFVLQDLLIGSVEELGEAGQDHRYGFGRLDVLRAIGFAHERGY